MDMSSSVSLMERGGVVIWLIATLSLVALTVIIWKTWRLARLGAWGGAAAERAVTAYRGSGTVPSDAGGGMRLRVVQVAIRSATDTAISDADAREETERVARRTLAEARAGLRALDVIATVAPLLGLLGTVLGMIGAFQALQVSGGQADPSVLAGGIWEALLTTAAGMGVAIPAALALAWFESVVENVAADMEDLATRIFLSRPQLGAAAE